MTDLTRSGPTTKRSQFAQHVLVRIREFTREPEAVFWTMFFPILLGAGLGVAFRNQPAGTVAVAATSPAVAQALRQDPEIEVIELAPGPAREALRIGRVTVVVEAEANGGVTYRYDDTNPESRTARLIADRAIQRAAGRTDPAAARDDLVRDPGSRYIDFVVPGLVGLGIMTNTIWGLGFSIVDSRRRKLVKRLVATPMSRTYYLLSHLVWRLLVLTIEVAIPIGFGAIAFDVPVRGRLLDLIVICVLASCSFSSLALLLASRAKTLEAISGLVNLVQIPMWVLSGVFFSAERFPAVVQPFIKALPLTAINDALRAHMLQGASLAGVAPELGVLTAWLVVCFVLALKFFRWQ